MLGLFGAHRMAAAGGVDGVFEVGQKARVILGPGNSRRCLVLSVGADDDDVSQHKIKLFPTQIDSSRLIGIQYNKPCSIQTGLRMCTYVLYRSIVLAKRCMSELRHDCATGTPKLFEQQTVLHTCLPCAK